MIAVIFEVEPAEGGCAAYLEHAARLRPMLEQMSLSFWRDESSVRAWREHPEHRATQAAGRAGIFRDYRLRVATVVRDYGLHERDQVPRPSAMVR